MRFLIDMNLTPRWVGALVDACHVAIHWSDVGPAVASDEQICEYARRQGLILITNDLDFPRILAYTRESKPSVLLLRGEPLVPELRAKPMLEAIASCAVELEAGAILTLDWSNHPRARLLPL